MSTPILEHAPPESRAYWCGQTCRKLLRPIVRLALHFGLKHKDLDEILRHALIDEALSQTRSEHNKKPNISRLAVITGLQRKDVSDRLVTLEAPEVALHSWPSLVFTAWLNWVADNPRLRCIPTTAPTNEPNYPSFSNLARLATKGNVHHRTVLNELLRLGLVEEQDDMVKLSEQAFIPKENQKMMLSFTADHGYDHLQAMLSNVIGEQPPFLEQSVFSEQVSSVDCVAAQALAKAHWQQLNHTLISYLTDAEQQHHTTPPTHRVRVGMYVYHEKIHES